jgi:hypothetical protein
MMEFPTHPRLLTTRSFGTKCAKTYEPRNPSCFIIPHEGLPLPKLWWPATQRSKMISGFYLLNYLI